MCDAGSGVREEKRERLVERGGVLLFAEVANDIGNANFGDAKAVEFGGVVVAGPDAEEGVGGGFEGGEGGGDGGGGGEGAERGLAEAEISHLVSGQTDSHAK